MPIAMYYMGVHIGATWRIWLNRRCAAAMRPYVKLFWSVVLNWFTAAERTDVLWSGWRRVCVRVRSCRAVSTLPERRGKLVAHFIQRFLPTISQRLWTIWSRWTQRCVLCFLSWYTWSDFFMSAHSNGQVILFYPSDFLWPPYGIGQAIIFLPCGFFYLSSSHGRPA